MTNLVVNTNQIEDRLIPLLMGKQFGEKIVTIEKKGKPYAVMMSPQEYKRYKEMSKKALWATIRSIQEKNRNVDPEEVMKDVEEVRQELYERGK